MDMVTQRFHQAYREGALGALADCASEGSSASGLLARCYMKSWEIDLDEVQRLTVNHPNRASLVQAITGSTVELKTFAEVTESMLAG